jgi:hypothetical protein
MLKYYSSFFQEFMTLTTYSLEIVKSLPAWTNTFRLPMHLLSQFVETLTRLTQLLPVSFNVIELCFEIINLVASGFFG